MRRSLVVFTLASSFMLFLLPSSYIRSVSADPTPMACEWGQVVYIVDGDTIDVVMDGSNYRVRYIGIDTAEASRPCYEEATAENRSLVGGQTVCLDKDVSETDRYGRLLRYVYVGDLFVNAELVRRGYASAATFPPDVRHADLFRQLEEEARQAGRGCWAAEISSCSPDANHDGIVNLFDLVAVSSRYGIQVSVGTFEDTNADGKVDLFDLVCVAANMDSPRSLAEVAEWCCQFDAPGNDHENLNEEYVCFENWGSLATDMTGWHVKDEHGWTYTFPAFTVAPGGHVRLRTGCGDDSANDVYWCHSGAVWNNDGDTVYLYDADWRPVDTYSY